MNATPSKPRRRWFQYSLRSLFIFITFLCLVLGWIVVPVQRQVNSVRTIQGLHGVVDYSEVPLGESWFRRVLRRILPRDYFDTVESVNLSPLGSKVTDSEIECLKSLTDLWGLELGTTQVTDEGLKYLQGMTKLERLSLCYTQVSDNGLSHLRDLKQLEQIDLRSTKVTDAGIVHLQSLTQLRMLVLHDTQVTEAGLEQLRHALPKCGIVHSFQLNQKNE